MEATEKPSVEGVLVETADSIALFLDPPTILAMSKVSKNLRQAYWGDQNQRWNEPLWKGVLQSQLSMFPDQETNTYAEDTPSRTLALTMQNLLRPAGLLLTDAFLLSSGGHRTR